MNTIRGQIVGVSDIRYSQNGNSYFDVIVFSEENGNTPVRIMEENYNNMVLQKSKSSIPNYEKCNLQNMSFYNFHMNFQNNSSFAEFTGLSGLSGDFAPAHYFQDFSSCYYITNVGYDCKYIRHYLGVKDVIEMYSLPTPFSIHGRIEWIDEFSQYGSGFTADVKVRKCYLYDLFYEDLKIKAAIWSEDYEEERPISDLIEGLSYRLEFMKVSDTGYSEEKTLTSTPLTKVYEL